MLSHSSPLDFFLSYSFLPFSLSLSLFLSLLQRDLKIDNLQSFFDDEDKNKSDNFERDFFDHKANYYQSKLGIEHTDDSVLLEQAKCYVVGIQWVLHYYCSGVPSWSW